MSDIDSLYKELNFIMDRINLVPDEDDMRSRIALVLGMTLGYAYRADAAETKLATLLQTHPHPEEESRA